MDSKIPSLPKLSERKTVIRPPSYTASGSQGEFDLPCPEQTASDIKDDHGINEWVLNHLALTEPQKEWLMAELLKEQSKDKITSPAPSKPTHSKGKMVRSYPASDRQKQPHRLGVKTLTKSS